MILYIIRHIQTPYNLNGILQGSRDISIAPIDDNTHQIISENCKKLNKIDFDTVLTTELKRTKETAALYNLSNTTTEPLLNELDFGLFEGRPKSEFIEEIGTAWKEDIRSVVLGESMTHFEDRLIQFLEKYKTYQNVLAFAHGGIIRALRSIQEFGKIDKMNFFHVQNNELYVLDFTPIKKKILILGGSKDQLPMINLAIDSGYETLVADFNPNVIGKRVADSFYELSIKDQAAVYKLAKDQKVDGICSMITEAGVMSIHNACKKLNLPNSYSLKAAEATFSKIKMREILMSNQINDLPFSKPKSLTEALIFTQEHGFPVVIKSSNSGGQNGLYNIRNTEELKRVFPLSIADSTDGSVILEKFVAGPELNVVYTVFQGKIQQLIIADRIKHTDAFGIVNRHRYPSKISSSYHKQMKVKCQVINDTLGIENGVVFPQFIYSEDEQEAILLEIGVRIPGGIMDQLTELATGIDLKQFCLDISLGQIKEYEHYKKHDPKPYVMVTFLNASPGPLNVGKIECVKGLEDCRLIPGVNNLDYFYVSPPNLYITPLKKGRDRFFFILSSGNTEVEAHNAAFKAFQKLEFLDINSRNLINHQFNFDRFYHYE